MVASVVKLLPKSPSPASVSLASTPLLGQSPTIENPPVAVRVASIFTHFIGIPSVGSIGLPSRHLVSVVAAAPSWLDARDHCPAAGAGNSANVIGPAGPDAAGAA